MKNKPLRLFCFAFLAPLCSASQVSSSLPYAGVFEPVLFATPQLGQKYSFSLTYYPLAFSQKTAFNVIASSLQKDYRGVPFTKKKILYSSTLSSLKSGDSLTLLCTIKPEDKMLEEEPNANDVMIEAVPDSGFAPIQTSLKLNFFRPTTWALPGSSPLARSYSTEWYEKFDGTPGNLPFAIFHEGFEGQFEDPSRGILPLKTLRLRNRFCDGSYQLFTSENPILRIYNNLNDFVIGERKRNERTEWLEIPLSLIPESTNLWSHLSLKDEIAVSLDQRLMKPADQKTSWDFLSKNFYFPPVKFGIPKTYDCSILFSKCGNQNNDTIVYDFTVYKSKNFFGSQNVSEWYLEETL